jgi:hypothetical protein
MGLHFISFGYCCITLENWYYLKISIPIFKKDTWERLEKDGKLEVTSEVDSLSEGYEMLKQ